MTTTDYEDDDRGTSSSRGRSSQGGGSRRGSAGGSSRRSGGGASSILSGLSTAGLLDIVERLGLVDMVVDRVKGRLEEVDVDEVIDAAGDYLKRNPEVLVVSLGAITIAAGALVYLNRRSEGGSRSRSSASSSTSAAGSTTSGGSARKGGRK